MLRVIAKSPNPNVLFKMKGRIKFPEKFKGTIVEKWADYWKNLFIDYGQMVKDLRTDIQDDPRKALKWTVGLAASYQLFRNNPNETDFKDNLKSVANEAILVSEECLNPKAIEHIRNLDKCYNEGVIHYQSLGLFSIMYLSNYNDSCSLYKTQCSYIQPSYLEFPLRIVDIGIFGRWWNIYMKTTNYDVNL